MKFYSLMPLASLMIIVGFLAGVGMVLCMMKESIFSTGGIFVLVAFVIAVFLDKAYRGCRIVDTSK